MISAIFPAISRRVKPDLNARGPRLAVATLCCLAVILTRLPSFSRSVLDWDESLYFLMAEQWRSGHLPYTTIWDNKPLGIYAIFAVFQDLFGDRIAAMRIAGIVFVSVAAFAVVRIGWLVTGAWKAALAGGAVFIVASLSNDGLADNTELFMVTFTSLAVLTALSAGASRDGGTSLGRAALAGVLMGAAFMVKYVAVLEDPAILLLLLWRLRFARAPAVILAALGGAALAPAAAMGLYWHSGLLALWWQDSVASNFRRAAKTVSPSALSYIWHVELLRWGPLYLGGAVMLAAAVPVAIRAVRARQLGDDQANHLFLALWLLGGCAGVAAAKSFFDHYFLQVLPVFCVTAGWLLHRPPVAATWQRPWILLLALLSLPVLAAVNAEAAALRPVLRLDRGGLSLVPDSERRIAAALAPQLAAAPGAIAYVFDGQPIIYALLHQAPPTRYVLPSVLTTDFLAGVAGVDAPAEVARILSTRPLFIIRRVRPVVSQNPSNPAVYAEVAAALAARYRLVSVDDGTATYRLTAPETNPNPGPAPAAKRAPG
jgi:hypothetical protein